MAKLRNYRQSTVVQKGFFADQSGRVWVTGTYGGGIQFQSSGSAANINSSSLCLLPVSRIGLTPPVVYDGA